MVVAAPWQTSLSGWRCKGRVGALRRPDAAAARSAGISSEVLTRRPSRARLMDDFFDSFDILMAINDCIYIYHGAIMAYRPKRQKPTIGFSARFFWEGAAPRKYLALSALSDKGS